MKAKSFLLLAIVISILFIQLTFASLPRYEVVDLGTLGGDDSSADFISNNGGIVGVSESSLFHDRAVLFDPTVKSSIIDLGTLGGDESGASSINTNRQIVGTASDSKGRIRATLFDATGSGNNTDLGTLGGGSSGALSVNEIGLIVGYAKNAIDDWRAVIFDPTGNGDNIDLGTLCGDNSFAYSINNSLQIVGKAETELCMYHKATLFDPTGKGNNMDLDPFHSVPSCAASINDDGQIVGCALYEPADDHPILFDSTGSGNNIDLGTLGGTWGQAWSINNRGQIVGKAGDNLGRCRATLFDPSGAGNNIDLNTLIKVNSRWILKEAWSINDAAWIVGQGINPDGEGHAFLMKPIPPKVIYVDDDAAGANDGSSWTDAYNYLQDALTVAWSGDEIHIAQGTYAPDSNSADPNGSGDREATFQLINGVTIKGGYAGTGEPDPNTRDIELYETILSGDLAGDDEPNFTNNSENSYHVVTGSDTDEIAVLDGCIVTAGNANGPYANGIDYSDGGGMYNDNGCPTLTNCTFRFNVASNLSHGGAMANKYSKPTLTGCIFIGNQAKIGGAMYNYVTQATLTDCTFIENSARSGGAIVSGGYLELINCKFIRNSALYAGGAINATAMTLNNCLFSENTADYGGAIGVADRSYATLTDCTFSSNSANNGGAIWMFDAGEGATLTNCTFTENAAYMGGGIHNSSYSSPTLTNCTFTANSAEDGGGMYNAKSNPTMINCTFSGNSAGIGGGGMYDCYESSPTLSNCTFKNNSAYKGAGMYNEESNPVLINCKFVGNRGGRGDGIYNIRSSPDLNNCYFIDNWLGMGNYYDSNSKLMNCAFTANFTAIDGFGSLVTLMNCAFSGNKYGTFFDYSSSKLKLTNCTFSGHKSLIGVDGGAVTTLTNCIVWGNDSLQYDYDGIVIINYSCIQGGFTGIGNIDTDPCFVSPGYWDANGTPDNANDDVWVDGDYHLLPDSPCIDVGDPSYIAEPNETDLNGRPRVIGGRIDMGAYETPIFAEARILPRTINLASKGKWITAFIWLPEAYDVADIDPDSVMLERQIKVEQFSVDVHNQVATAKFSREDVQSILEVGDIKLTITCQLTDGTYFEATDMVQVTDKGIGQSAK